MKNSSPNKTEKKNSEKKSNENRLNLSYKLPIEKIVILLCILTSLGVLSGWFLGYEKILSIIPGSATMKFNSALIFLIAGINLILFHQKEKPYQITFKVLSVITILIGAITLADFFGLTYFNIDNIFVKDVFSETKPGIMSPATALCAFLLGFGFLGFISTNNIIKKIGKNAVNIISIISLLSILTYVLLIPSENKTSLFQTMAIHTAILFFIISVVLILKNPNSIINNMINGHFTGSKIFRQLLPKVIIFPLILGNILLVCLNRGILNADFGIVTYTLILILLSIMYISYVAYGLNITEENRLKLEKNVKNTNKNLKRFKEGLNKVAIVAITDHKGTINYVNDAFCKISKYTREELIGSTHALVNAEHHTGNFMSKMNDTMNLGEIWIGDIKNKAKDGTFYWIHTSIIPFKNDEGRITEFLYIKQDITKSKLKKIA